LEAHFAYLRHAQCTTGIQTWSIEPQYSLKQTLLGSPLLRGLAGCTTGGRISIAFRVVRAGRGRKTTSLEGATSPNRRLGRTHSPVLTDSLPPPHVSAEHDVSEEIDFVLQEDFGRSDEHLFAAIQTAQPRLLTQSQASFLRLRMLPQQRLGSSPIAADDGINDEVMLLMSKG
jgi:hypothetical protein